MKVSDKILRRFFPAGVLLGSTGESENSLTFDATRPGPPLPKVPTALFPVADWGKDGFYALLMPCLNKAFLSGCRLVKRLHLLVLTTCLGCC
jgi:hypothetical protein